MSAFKSEKILNVTLPNLTPVGEELIAHFREQGFEVMGSETDGGAWEVSITKGGMFKKTVGLSIALRVEIIPRPSATLVRAGAGVFKRQAVPTAMTMLVAWPVVLSQAWGLIRQSGLDDEAVKVVELSLSRHARSHQYAGITSTAETATAEPAAPRAAAAKRFCTSCGQQLASEARFCPGCGSPQGDAMTK